MTLFYPHINLSAIIAYEFLWELVWEFTSLKMNNRAASGAVSRLFTPPSAGFIKSNTAFIPAAGGGVFSGDLIKNSRLTFRTKVFKPEN